MNPDHLDVSSNIPTIVFVDACCSYGMHCPSQFRGKCFSLVYFAVHLFEYEGLTRGCEICKYALSFVLSWKCTFVLILAGFQKMKVLISDELCVWGGGEGGGGGRGDEN